MGQLPDRGRVLCQGHIESVTFVPADRTAEFSAIVTEDDAVRPAGPGQGRPPRLRVVWLGRRRVPGIEAGAEIRVEGMLARGKDMPTIFNPRYEILSRQENE
ncbi:OB-fold nucleic acid binding domain-containing protein [Pseudarthrobacter sp. CC12]|uniref:OB-fold nucleic acid binding domain-containing protein n=1 Tax=unclassified Pseudarthrobacter TaxID=2647000 RepID=UPI00113035F8|nr:OB-fold nucleic acid binding domain-containing protein [Pseudarthrobacter sp. NIBRBAC000502771]QDG64754.1 hypothetical protein NIBR502771_17335 [Pseudarthrobacter sp. NIBRBAC000502771]